MLLWWFSAEDFPRQEFLVTTLILLGASLGLFGHALFLVLVISLVYGATRHESLGPILYHAYRTAFWIVGFVIVIALVLSAISWFT
jgi:hypothetical protein